MCHTAHYKRTRITHKKSISARRLFLINIDTLTISKNCQIYYTYTNIIINWFYYIICISSIIISTTTLLTLFSFITYIKSQCDSVCRYAWVLGYPSSRQRNISFSTRVKCLFLKKYTIFKIVQIMGIWPETWYFYCRKSYITIKMQFPTGIKAVT